MGINLNNIQTMTLARLSLPLVLAVVSAAAWVPAAAAENTAEQTASGFAPVALEQQITDVQPMTGLVLWPDHDLMPQYQDVVTLEYSYCLPCRVVRGKQDGRILYDWTYIEELLDDIRSRGHQAILRFRYEYPGSKDADGKTKGATAVPQYIKDLSDYHETYNKNAGGDGPTYYADWSNSELQWFTKQFFADFAARYNDDPRIAFLEVGFGHWSEYHIYGTALNLGVNFPSKAYQKAFFLHLDTVLTIPWAVSIDAADDTYTPITGDAALMALGFGLFDDSFMHKDHEIGSKDGYNEECWNAIGNGVRWKTGVCGGEISYYKDQDQKEFLNPAGMYGVTWEEAAAKYHISFMIANDAPGSTYGTVARFKQAGMAAGYRFVVTRCETNGMETRLTVCNEGVAPLYRDAYFAIGNAASETSLRGLLPGEKMTVSIPSGLDKGDDLHIVSPHILPGQTIRFGARIEPSGRATAYEDAVPAQKQLRNNRLVILRRNAAYDVLGVQVR